MTFESGSSLLNARAITARLLDRGRHFHLVENPSISSNPYPASYSGKIQGPAIPATFIASDSDDKSSLSGVTFALRPPTVNREDCARINEAVHLEWLKGRGASWISGSPELRYCGEQGFFEIRVTDMSMLSAHDPSAALVTESGLAATLDTLEDAALDECLSKHLTEGGDDRLFLSDEGVNKYYCPPRPLPSPVIVRGSCTCSSPTPDGFEAARRLLRDLWSGRTKFSTSVADVAARLSRGLELSVPHDVILHPSGSDAELIPLTVACARAQRLGCAAIVNIVVAAGEVGSGTAPAAGGRHFSKYSPLGSVVVNGGLVNEFPSSTVVVEIGPRAECGDCFADYDGRVREAVVKAHRELGDPFIVLHAVDGSKTGLRVPSRELLLEMKEKLGSRVLLVMDACQCRSDADELDWFLKEDAVVLVTASKFFSAPGFCGAVLVPKSSVTALDEWTSPPSGLTDYLTKYEVPTSMRGLRSTLPDGPQNIGLLLRWACGITEIELFQRVGPAARKAIGAWVKGVRELVCARNPKLELIDTDVAQDTRDCTRTGGVNSVVSIKFLSACGSKHLDASTLKKLHRLLTIDASKALPGYAGENERKKAALQCMVGQPVKLGEYGVLRLAIGAPQAREIARCGNVAEALKDDARILDKMVVLGKYCDDIVA